MKLLKTLAFFIFCILFVNIANAVELSPYSCSRVVLTGGRQINQGYEVFFNVINDCNYGVYLKANIRGVGMTNGQKCIKYSPEIYIGYTPLRTENNLSGAIVGCDVMDKAFVNGINLSVRR